MKITIVYADISAEAGKDEQDVLIQAEAVRKSLEALEHEVSVLPVTLDVMKTKEALACLKPDYVFNLVESLDGTGRFIHFVPALLEHMAIPFTGCGSESLYTTTNKIRTKEQLRYAGIDTPDWTAGGSEDGWMMDSDPPYIVKPAWEDASVGLDDASIVYTREDLAQVFREKVERYGHCLVESYVEGREFNVSLLAAKETGVQVLPVAEILFAAYPAGKPRIVGYDAKWEPSSFEYSNTPRSFDFPANQNALIEHIEHIARRCWDIFGLRGYARVDFRVGQDSRPWVIEINANPCISPGAGFEAAADRAGIQYNRMIERILEGASVS